MDYSDKIFIAGHRGMVGSAILRKLEKQGYSNFILKNSNELDLINQRDVRRFFDNERPDYVFMAAAKVGGILANNTYRAQFIYENLMIQNNIIHSSHINKVKKLLFLGSSCIYPKKCSQPMKEHYLLSDQLEFTNEPYAIAKISGIKMCESYYRQYKDNFISVMPTNLYGINDNFNLQSSHVLPALIKKIHDGKVLNLESVEIWGTGKAKREFLNVDDLADACIHIFNSLDASKLYDEMKLSHINIGSGSEIRIIDLAILIGEIIGYKGKFKFDLSKPDGTPRKLLSIDKLNKIGWNSKIDLKEGIRETYEWFKKNID